MRLYEEYMPATLDEVVGQPPVRLLQDFARHPYPCCFLLEGPPGIGKTTSALALGHDLGSDDEMSGLYIVPCSEFSIEKARQMFLGDADHSPVLRLSTFQGRGWKVLVLEELEWLSPQCQNFLKVHLDANRMPSKLVVMATSNGAGKLQKALLQRFRIYTFQAGPSFAQAAWERMGMIWRQEMGDVPMPEGWQGWGWQDHEFSLRVALDQLQDHLVAQEIAT